MLSDVQETLTNVTRDTWLVVTTFLAASTSLCKLQEQRRTPVVCEVVLSLAWFRRIHKLAIVSSIIVGLG